MINNRQRSQSMAELAATMGSAISALSLERFSLWGALLHAHPERRLDATPLPREVDAKQRERLLYR